MILMISDKKEEVVSTEAVDPDLNLTKIKIKQKTEMLSMITAKKVINTEIIERMELLIIKISVSTNNIKVEYNKENLNNILNTFLRKVNQKLEKNKKK